MFLAKKYFVCLSNAKLSVLTDTTINLYKTDDGKNGGHYLPI